MKLKFPRTALTTAFQTVAGVVPSRTPKDILKNVKLQVGRGRAVLVGSDSETSLRCEISEVESDAEGETLLPTARVLSILRELSGEAVELVVEGDSILIKSGSSEFRLSSEDPADFPPVATFEDADYFSVPTGFFRQMIRRVIFATDVESTRYALGGVLVEIGDNAVTLAATDSRRLALMPGSIRKEGEPVVGVAQPVVPSKAMALVERTLGDSADEVHLAIHANDVAFRYGSTVLTSQLVQGRFPDYRKVVPTEFTYNIDLVAGPFHSAVRQSQIVTSEESRGVDFRFGDGLLRLSSEAADIGQAKIEVPIAFDGPELSITFDPRFIAEFLRVLEPGTAIQFRLVDSDSAAVLATEDGYVYVIMPLARDH